MTSPDGPGTPRAVHAHLRRARPLRPRRHLQVRRVLLDEKQEDRKWLLAVGLVPWVLIASLVAGLVIGSTRFWLWGIALIAAPSSLWSRASEPVAWRPRPDRPHAADAHSRPPPRGLGRPGDPLPACGRSDQRGGGLVRPHAGLPQVRDPDLERAYQAASLRDPQNGAAALLPALGGVPASPNVHRVQVVLDTLGDEEWLVQVRHWRDPRALSGRVDIVCPAPPAAGRPSPAGASRPPTTEAVLRSAGRRRPRPTGPAPRRLACGRTPHPPTGRDRPSRRGRSSPAPGSSSSRTCRCGRPPRRSSRAPAGRSRSRRPPSRRPRAGRPTGEA